MSALIFDYGDQAKLTDTLVLTWFVDDAGDRFPVIADNRLADQKVPVLYGQAAFAAYAPHELLGPLPAIYAERVEPLHRCGAPASTGRPCRSIVTQPGDRCWHHRPHLPGPDHRYGGER